MSNQCTQTHNINDQPRQTIVTVQHKTDFQPQQNLLSLYYSTIVVPPPPLSTYIKAGIIAWSHVLACKVNYDRCF